MAKVDWLNEVIEGMKKLGGSASYSDLYVQIRENGNIDFSKRKDPRAQIRGVIESYSSDSKYHEKYTNINKPDIFYSVYGIGKGYWGLRDYIPIDSEVDLTEDDNAFIEGKKNLRLHVIRERNPQVIKKAIEEYKKKFGKLVCEICSFNFEEKYGDIGKDFIEGHHTIPVSELEDGEKTKAEDIALVCSNCHKMLHRKRPWLKTSQLKELLVNR